MNITYLNPFSLPFNEAAHTQAVLSNKQPPVAGVLFEQLTFTQALTKTILITLTIFGSWSLASMMSASLGLSAGLITIGTLAAWALVLMVSTTFRLHIQALFLYGGLSPYIPSEPKVAISPASSPVVSDSESPDTPKSDVSDAGSPVGPPASSNNPHVSAAGSLDESPFITPPWSARRVTLTVLAGVSAMVFWNIYVRAFSSPASPDSSGSSFHVTLNNNTIAPIAMTTLAAIATAVANATSTASPSTLLDNPSYNVTEEISPTAQPNSQNVQEATASLTPPRRRMLKNSSVAN